MHMAEQTRVYMPNLRLIQTQEGTYTWSPCNPEQSKSGVFKRSKPGMHARYPSLKALLAHLIPPCPHGIMKNVRRAGLQRDCP